MNTKRILGALVVILLTICFIADVDMYIQLGGIVVAYFIMALFIIVALSVHLINRYYVKDKMKEEVIGFQIKYNFMPKVVIYSYTLFLVFGGLTERRFLSSNLQTFINGLSAIAVFYLCGKAAFYYSYVAVILSYVSVLIAGIGKYGTQVSVEFHDLAFSVGYIIIYFLYTNSWKNRKNLIISIVFLLMFLGAGKRSGLLALFLTIIWWKLASLLKRKKRFKFIIASGVLFFIVNIVFIQLVTNPGFLDILSHSFINMSGRDYYYAALQNYIRNDITFLGLGRNAVQIIMTENFPWFNVGNVHSDILRMYAECGFVLFILWLGWYLIKMEVSGIKKYGMEAGGFIFASTFYTFIIYFTDNTELYLMNQYFYVLVMLMYVYNILSKKNLGEK